MTPAVLGDWHGDLDAEAWGGEPLPVTFVGARHWTSEPVDLMGFGKHTAWPVGNDLLDLLRGELACDGVVSPATFV